MPLRGYVGTNVPSGRAFQTSANRILSSMIRRRMSLWSGRTSVSFVLAVAIVGFATLPRRALAAGDDDAAVRLGLDLRRQGKDQEALEAFQKAYERNKSARVLAQIGLAEQALGHWVDAEAHVEQALSDETQPWIRKNGPTLKSALAEIQRHIGSLQMVGPPGAEVSVNGQIVGTLPFPKPARVPIGTVNVVLRKEGYLPTTRPVSIAAGALTRESISLQMIEPVPQQRVEAVPTRSPDVTPISTPPPPLPPGPDRVDNEARRDPIVENSSGGTWQRPVAWVAAVGAVLGVAGGGAALFIRSRRLKEANDLQCRVMGGTVNPVDPANGGRCLSLADTASNMSLTAVVAFSVAGVLAVGSAVLFATTTSKGSPVVSLACAPVVAIPGAVCQLQF
jgi:hypothetical protein